ncbi:MAG: hypothetical protein HYX34_13825 [Actinobacteria bacterium]|nr:hypothetical protein [Actinomycetota bacterium]
MSPAREAHADRTDGTITRDDIEAKFREIQGDIDETAESAKSMALAIGAAAAAVIVIGVFLLGRRRGRRKSTVVEIRRI